MTDAQPSPASNHEDAPQDPPTAATPPPSIPDAPAIPPAPSAPPKQPRKPRTWLAATAGAIAGAAIVGSIWAITANSEPDKPATFTLTGSFTLTDEVDSTTDGGCEGSYDSGYDDIEEGADVTVYNAAGAVVGKGELGNSEEIAPGTCTFDISIADVPKGEAFYKVEVSHRGTVELTAKEAENGELAATFG